MLQYTSKNVSCISSSKLYVAYLFGLAQVFHADLGFVMDFGLAQVVVLGLHIVLLKRVILIPDVILVQHIILVQNDVLIRNLFAMSVVEALVFLIIAQIPYTLHLFLNCSVYKILHSVFTKIMLCDR